MNGTSRVSPNSEPDDDGLDPALTHLFDTAPAPADADAFIRSTLRKLDEARRARLLRRCAAVLVTLVVSALVAPYAAWATLLVSSRLAEWLPAAGVALVSPIAWGCAALVVWSVIRRTRTH
jgi:hypothetical protein